MPLPFSVRRASTSRLVLIPALRPVAAALAAWLASYGSPALAAGAIGGSGTFAAGHGGQGSYSSGVGQAGTGGAIPSLGGAVGYTSQNEQYIAGGVFGGNGAPGSAGNSGAFAAGGGAGGGTALHVFGTPGFPIVESTVAVTGGAGGNGGANGGVNLSDPVAGAGGGGGGGDGIELFSAVPFTFINHGLVSGGAGGKGGTTSIPGDRAGGGGAGGNGISAPAASGIVVTIENNGLISGGSGGNSLSGAIGVPGGQAGGGGTGVVLNGARLNNLSGGVIAGGSSGAFGDLIASGMNAPGGFGVSMANGTLTNAGVIRGGDGQYGGYGVYVTGAGTLINSGTIQGGMVGGTRGESVVMMGNNARLELWSGYTFNGLVRSSGMLNVLALGGPTDSSFDVSQLGTAYTGFTTFEKSGASTWQLTGVTNQLSNWTVRDGTLAISDGRQLGGSGSTISLGNARLAYAVPNDYTSIASNVSLLPGTVGTIDVGDNSTLALSRGVDGPSATLRKDGSGTLNLDGPASFRTLAINEGTVLLNNSTLPAEIQNRAVAGVYTSSNLSYAGKISGFNGDSGQMIKYGLATLTLTGINTLDWSIRAGGLTAAPDRFQGNVSIGLGTRFTLDGPTDATYAGTLSDAGVFTKAGTGKVTLTADSSGFSGSTQIAQGVLNMGANARLGGPVAVGNGATLSGSGRVAKVDVQPGGKLALTGGDFKVDGDATLLPGSTLSVRADPNGTPGRLVAGGTVDLQGSNLLHVGVGDGFALNSKYTIVSASQVQGQFASVSSQYAYLTAQLDYNGSTRVDLELVRRTITPPVVTPPIVTPPGVTPSQPEAPRPIRIEDLAQTPNQRAVGVALESLPQNNPLFQAVITLPEGEPPQALAALSGESLASTASALSGLGANARVIPLAQLRRGLGAAPQPGAPMAAAGLSDAPLPSSVLPGSDVLPAWAQVVGQWQRAGGEDGIARTRQQTGGVYAGADGAVGGGWRLGGALGVTNSKLKVDSLNSQSDIDSYSAAIYGGRRYDAGSGHINVLLGAAYTWHDIGSKRNVSFTGVNQKLEANYGASTGQLFGEVGYGLPMGERAVIEPYLGLAFNDQRVRGFSESGGSAALSGQSQHDQTTATTLGLRGTKEWDTVALTAGAGWRYAFGDVNPASTLAFAGSEAFTVAGAPIARNAMVAELAGQWRASRNMAFTLAYDGEYGGGNQQHAGTLRMNWRF